MLETLHIYQNDQDESVQMTFEPQKFGEMALEQIGINVVSDPAVIRIALALSRPPCSVTYGDQTLQHIRKSPQRKEAAARFIAGCMKIANEVVLSKDPQRSAPENIVFENVSPDTAREIIAYTQNNPNLEISCVLRNSHTDQQICSITRVPYVDKKYKLKGSEDLYAFMQGSKNVTTRTFIKRRKY